MDVRSNKESGSVGVVLGNPLIGANDIGSELNIFPNTYTHKIVANGGFWDAQFATATNLLSTLPSINSLIGLDVRCISRSNQRVWHGFVNTVTVDTGLGSFTIGPLLQVRNNLSVVYQTTRYNTNPPIGGQQRRLDPVSDNDSVARYGILGHELSGGSGDSEGAVALQTTHLQEHRNPRVDQSLSVGAGARGSTNLSIQCLGYVHLLDKFIYAANVAGYQTTQEKIQAVLSAEPNGLFGDLLFEGGDLLDVPIAESGATGWAAIKAAVSVGDELANRYVFGIQDNLVAYYNRVDTNYTYYMRPDGNVYGDSGRIDAWDIQAGVWLDASSLIPGSPISGEMGSRISDVFIESVTYTAPISAQIEGGRVDRSIQQLAQRGVGGSF